jgi:hypothetical protein
VIWIGSAESGSLGRIDYIVPLINDSNARDHVLHLLALPSGRIADLACLANYRLARAEGIIVYGLICAGIAIVAIASHASKDFFDFLELPCPVDTTQKSI